MLLRSITSRLTSRHLAGAVTALAITASGAAIAQDTVPAAVKARQSHMQLNAYNLGILGGMAKGAVAYDAEAASAAASNLATLATMNTSSYWAPGTSTDDIVGTKALPAIWEEGSDIGAKAAALATAAAAMAEAAGTDLAALQGAMGPLGGACGSCHKAYRE